MKTINLNNYKTEFYKDKLKNCKEISEVPFTTKAELVQSQKEIPPFGGFTDYKREIFQIYRTSGTSDNPLLLSFTKNDVDLMTDIGAEVFRHCGMGDWGNDEVVINCLNLSMWAGGFFDAQAIMKTGVQVVNFGTGNTIELLKLIFLFNKKFKVSLHCTPSYLPIIEQKLIDDYKKTLPALKIHALYLGAEGGVQNISFRNNLINKWECKVYNANYGMSEVCSIMASATDDNVLKFSVTLLEKYFFELLLADGSLLPFSDSKPGDTGDIVVSSLFKESQPLLRYHTKERIKIISIDKEGVYFEVIGRSDDMIVYKGINVFPEQFRTSVCKFPELTGLYKLIVERKNFLVTNIYLVCEVKKGISFDEKIIKQKLTQLIKGNISIRPEIRFIEAIEREGNKVRIVEIKDN
ncbi:MAG: hypothetical protein PHR81_00405 [Bacteroidales bacterium]|jgi:phenylacetate-CoA ligase|nr:hypothetical protein [Bacteroidales bacterium]MDD4213248.1 hypothetical protein [Bacteroidales bacterium]